MTISKGTEALLSYEQCFLYFVSSVRYKIQETLSLFFILRDWIPSGQTSYIMLLTSLIVLKICLRRAEYTHFQQ